MDEQNKKEKAKKQLLLRLSPGLYLLTECVKERKRRFSGEPDNQSPEEEPTD